MSGCTPKLSEQKNTPMTCGWCGEKSHDPNYHTCKPEVLEMPVCQHLIPIKFSCLECDNEKVDPAHKELNIEPKEENQSIKEYVNEEFSKFDDYFGSQHQEARVRLDNLEADSKSFIEWMSHYEKGLFEKNKNKWQLEIENKLKELKLLDECLSKDIPYLNKRITAAVKDYNEMNIRRCEENTSISRKITDLERNHQALFEMTRGRLEKTENDLNYSPNFEYINSLEKKYNDSINIFDKRISEIESWISERSHHYVQCPQCKGNGVIPKCPED
jgi:hypothetical protein